MIEFEVYSNSQGAHPLIGLRWIRFGGCTTNQLFIRGSVGLKEQELTLGVKRYIDSALVTNNLLGWAY